MFCSKCGTEVSDNFKFCSACGKEINSYSIDDNANNISTTQSPLVKLSSQQESENLPINKGRTISEGELLLFVESQKKSGLNAALLNLFLPGAGYVYCGNWLLGIFAFLFVIFTLIASLGYAVFLMILMLVIDGFLCADRYNKKIIENVITNREKFDRL